MGKTGKSGNKTVFVCSNCGNESVKWLGRCPYCKEWNTFFEQQVVFASRGKTTAARDNQPQQLSEVKAEQSERQALPMEELNRVMGGGIVAGSMVLLGGEPGIGKSTMLLQLASQIISLGGSVVYVSGEETHQQIKLRARRLGISGENLFLLTETNIESILEHADQMQPALLIIDSIQTMFSPDIEGMPGNVSQVRECTLRLMRWAKPNAVPVFIAGHVTKDGAIAGPRQLEHIVDVVLYFEGDAFNAYRLLRCVKNRYGSTNEVGVFEMKTGGLAEVPNPSEVFISQRGEETTGSSIVPVLEGTRPLLVEIQALASPTSFGLPRRTANGIDFNRLLMLIAVLSRRTGLKLGAQDVMVNVIGGMRIREPAADLGVALAVASSLRDVPVNRSLVAIGEVGLSGELRMVSRLDQRVAEAARLGFTRCIVPKSGAKSIAGQNGIQVIPVRTLREAIMAGLDGSRLTE